MKYRRPLGFPLSKPKATFCVGQEGTLATGVRGYAIRAGGKVYIPLITAEREGAGDVGRFLDALPTWITIRVPNIIAPRLTGMLARRGFVAYTERVQDGPFKGETVDWMERRPA